MKTRYFWVPFLGGFLVALLSSYILVKPFLKPEIQVDVFQPKYRNLDGKPISLNKASEKIRLINYWATWCKPCVAEFKDFRQLKETYGDKLEIIAVSDEAPGTIEAFKKKHRYDFNYLYTPENFSTFGLHVRPVNVILDKDGNVVYSKAGALSVEELEKILKSE